MTRLLRFVGRHFEVLFIAVAWSNASLLAVLAGRPWLGAIGLVTVLPWLLAYALAERRARVRGSGSAALSRLLLLLLLVLPACRDEAPEGSPADTAIATPDATAANAASPPSPAPHEAPVRYWQVPQSRLFTLATQLLSHSTLQQ